jgi:Na+/proline symporter
MDFALQSLDYWAILIYMLLMAGIGLFFGWFIKDASAYLKGSGTIPWVVAGISNFMALFSTFVFVAYAGIAYDDGLVAVTVMLTTVPACLFASIFLAKRWRRLHMTSPIALMCLYGKLWHGEASLCACLIIWFACMPLVFFLPWLHH